ALCASCGTLFPLRKGQSARGNCYCDSLECAKASLRAASRRYYAKQKANPDRGKQQKEKLTESQTRLVLREWEKWKEKDGPKMQFYLKYADKFRVSERTIRRVLKEH